MEDKKAHRVSDFPINAYHVIWKEFGVGHWKDANEVIVACSEYVLHFVKLGGFTQADAIFHLLRRIHPKPDRFKAFCELHSPEIEPISPPPKDVRPHYKVAPPEGGWRRLLPSSIRG